MNKERPDQPQPLTLEAITRQATERLLRDGSHVPMLIVEGHQAAVALEIAEIPSTHERRLQQMFVLGFLLAQDGEVGLLHQVFFVTEAWMSAIEGGQRPAQPPSADPNRREILMISAYQPTIQKVEGVMIEMLRDEAQKLRELRPLDVPSGEESRMESPLLVAFADGFMRGLR